MKLKIILCAWLVGFVVMFVLAMLWYAFIIADYHEVQFASVLRGHEDFSVFKLFIGYLIFSFILAYIYPIGYSGDQPLHEGFRYGLLMGLFFSLGTAFIYSGAYQFPLVASLVDAAYHTVEIIAGAIVMALIYHRCELSKVLSRDEGIPPRETAP